MPDLAASPHNSHVIWRGAMMETTMTSCMTRSRWSPLHIAAVIAGFIVWWPLGLLALAYFLWGDRIPRDRVREGFERAKAEFAAALSALERPAAFIREISQVGRT